MEPRKREILNIIIKEYIKTAEPVGSGTLKNKYKLNISSATVRNEMAELEAEGYIIQPHISAGRVPTEKAYRVYLENLKEKKLDKESLKTINWALSGKDEAGFKKTAKIISELSGGAIFWAFYKNNSYCTGVSKLLSQPEFFSADLILDISLIIDQLDEIISDNFDGFDYGEKIFLGSDNPFSEHCGTVMIKYKLKERTGLFGILGPVRMDYEKNLGLIRAVEAMVNGK
jgi:heat-inducible transcriptional repressor